jgi:hypothetical protein
MLENVKHVEHLMGSISSPAPVDEVNQFLRLGWKLINVHVARASCGADGDEGATAATIGYIVGWDSQHVPPTYPKGGFHDRCGRIPPVGAVAAAE